MGWDYKKTHVSWIWGETTFWTGEVAQLLGRSIWEILSSVSPKLYKVRIGVFQKRFKYYMQGSNSWPVHLRVTKYMPIPRRHSHSPSYVSQLTQPSQYRSQHVKLRCHPFLPTGQPFRIPDKHSLCHAGTWTPFVPDPKSATFRVLISSAVHSY